MTTTTHPIITRHLLARSFDGLSPGLAFTSPPRTVSDEDVVAFADLTGDHHPLHLDDAFAHGTPFGGRIAHGMLVASLAVGMLPLDPEYVVALRAVREVVFKAPVHLGDTIALIGTIAELREIDEEVGLVTVRCRILTADDRLAARLELDALWRRAPEVCSA